MFYTSPNLNQKLIDILVKKYDYTPEMIRSMQETYVTSILTIIFNQTSLYFVGRPEEAELAELADFRNKSQAELFEQGLKISKKVFTAYANNTKLQAVIDEKIMEMKNDLIKIFIDKLEVDELNEFLEAVKEEAELAVELEKILGQQTLEI